MNITLFFWRLIQKIVELTVDELQETREYEKMCQYISSKQLLEIDLGDYGEKYKTHDANDLFQKTLQYYKKHNKEKFELLFYAMKKIYHYLQTEDETEHLFDNFKL
jgi:hypothetical protein